MRDLVETDRAQPRIDLVGREPFRGSAQPVQRFLRREAGDLPEAHAARGQAFGRGRRSAPQPSEEGREGGSAVLRHALVSIAGTG